MENWIEAILESEYRYDVSDYGNVRKKGANSNISKRINTKGNYVVSLRHKNNSKDVFMEVYVKTLVMRSFYPEMYYNRRQVSNINGDITDCRLQNLKWSSKTGFEKEIDMDYVINIDDSGLDEVALQIKKYLINKDQFILLDMVNNLSSYIFVILKDHQMINMMNEYKTDLFLWIKKSCDCGGLRPINGLKKGFIQVHIKGWIKNHFRAKKRREINTDRIDVISNINVSKNYTYNEVDCLSNEIDDIFLNFVV